MNQSRLATTRRCASLAAFLVGLVLAAPGTAMAHHDNGTQLCNSKFVGSFSNLTNLPLYRNGPGSTRLGYVSANVQWQDNRSKYRVCVVTIRRWHSSAQTTNAWAIREGAYNRQDPGSFYRYAGPVVGGIRRGQSMNGGGAVRDACARFVVSWPRNGSPEFNGGGC